MLKPTTIKTVEPSCVPAGLINLYAKTLRPSSCVYMQFKKNSSPKAKDQYHDYKKQLKKWLQANISGKNCCITSTGGRSIQMWILFESDSDAMVFRLSWETS